jgi:hypothetical protein
MDEVQVHLFELQIDPSSQAALSDGAKWGKFLAIIGFIFCGLIVIGAIGLGVYLGSAANVMGTAYAGGMGLGISMVYIFMAAIYFFPCLFLYNYSNQIKEAIATSNQEAMAKGFSNLRTLFKFVGILMIVVIGLMLLSAIVVVASIAMTSNHSLGSLH